jgi:hypothetical protein
MSSATVTTRATPDKEKTIETFLDQVDISTIYAKEALVSRIEQIKTWWANRHDQLPQWAEQHIALHRKLNCLLQTTDPEEINPALYARIRRSHESSSEAFGAIANVVKFTLFKRAAIPQQSPYEQHHGLLTSEAYVPQNQTESRLNMALLMDAHQRTEDPLVKRKIEFLAMNYLAKAAPPPHPGEFTSSVEREELLEPLQRMLQIPLASLTSEYHREGTPLDRDDKLKKAFKTLLAPEATTDCVLIDNTEIQELFPLFFPTIPDISACSSAGSSASASLLQIAKLSVGFANIFTEYLTEHSQDPFAAEMKTPILLDLTGPLKDFIVTEGESGKIERYEGRRKQIEQEIDHAIDLTFDQLKEAYPQIGKSLDGRIKFKIFVKANLFYVCRARVKDMSVLLTPSMFRELEDFLLPTQVLESEKKCTFNGFKLQLDVDVKRQEAALKNIAMRMQSNHQYIYAGHLANFFNLTGTRIGAVSGRMESLSLVNFDTMVREFRDDRYTPSGMNVKYFNEKEDITHATVFRRLKEATHPAPGNSPPPSYVSILGGATTDILEGLMKDIPITTWHELNANPATRMILQQSLLRLFNHLADAENHQRDFVRFSEAIELAHCEMTTLLTLATPYASDAFAIKYAENVRPIVPAELRPHVKAGAAKSAMNAFAGINAAIYAKNPKSLRVCATTAYFEESRFIKECTMQRVREDSSAKVDLYVGEFNHNIQHSATWDSYSAGTVMADVEELLATGKAVDHMTIAIDCTIDYGNSARVKMLLEHFSEQIKSGQLNFVFFRSGQKFDMLGMDNYYGAPFWMVNNGDSKLWGEFDRLINKKTYQTDPLTNQWLALIQTHAPGAVDAYKHQYFTQSRAILDQVPPEIKPHGKYSEVVRVSAVEPEVDTTFIDIKVFPDNIVSSYDLQQLFVQKALEAGVRVHNRGSFGFYHPNWGVLPTPKEGRFESIRINPGLDPKDNEFIIKFLQEIPSMVEKIRAKRLGQTAQ